MKGDIFLFEEILSFFKGKPILVATTIMDLIKKIRRDGHPVDNLSDQHFIDLFQTLDDGIIAKEAVESVLIYLTQHPLKSVQDSIKKMQITSISQEDLGDLINKIVPQFKELIKERKMGAMGPVMGAVMKEVRGRIDGKLVNQAVKEAILRLSGGNKQ
jgi:glutamyl-tRNA(Gln) amidotransferase subunit E